MNLEDFNFELPEELIAQNPVSPRDSSRLLVYDSENDEIRDVIFRDLVDVLGSDDVLVVNRSKVRDARILFEAEGKVREIFVLKSLGEERYRCMVRPGKYFGLGKEGEVKGLFFKVVEILEDGTRVIDFSCEEGVDEKLQEVGNIPLPPYITKSKAKDEQYQTVYADRLGSVAAPTAGLHFTEDLFERLSEKGVELKKVLLHVGRGTFLPVKSEKISEHEMHKEYYDFAEDVAGSLNERKSDGANVVAVGTTSVRVLESNFKDGAFRAGCGETDIFIYPGYEWKAVDKLITNFHLPKSTLIMLVASFLQNKGVEDGIAKVKEIYAHAIKNKYRFYSFGDAMLIL